MKHTRIVAVSFLMCVFCQIAICQTSNRRDTTPVSKKQNLLNNILQQLSDSLNKPKQIPTDKNSRIAYEFNKLSIYPSDDALELLYILNPWLNNDETEIPATRIIKYPDFPTLGTTKRRELKEMYKAATRPDSRSGIRYDSIATAFNQTMDAFLSGYQRSVSEKSKFQSKLKLLFDKLQFCQDKVVPDLKLATRGWTKARADYLNNEFIELVNSLKNLNKINDEDLSFASFVADDFLKTSGFTYFKKNNGAFGPKSLQAYTPDIDFSKIDFLPNGTFVPNDAGTNNNTDVLKCRIYIYDREGKVIKGRFHVYFAPFITTYNLQNITTAADTLLYISSGQWDAGEASTAAIAIPNNSNWAIYCEDNSTQHVYLINQKYNYQNIPGLGEDETDNKGFYRICIIYRGN